MRSSVIERHDALSTILRNGIAHPRIDQIQRLGPAGLLEVAAAACARANERMQHALRAMYPLGGLMGHLAAQDPVGIGQGVRSAHSHDAISLHAHGEAAGVRAVEGADTGAVDGMHGDRAYLKLSSQTGPSSLSGIS